MNAKHFLKSLHAIEEIDTFNTWLFSLYAETGLKALLEVNNVVQWKK